MLDTLRNFSFQVFADSELLPLLLICLLAYGLLKLLFLHLPQRKVEPRPNKEAPFPFLQASRYMPVYTHKDWYYVTVVTVLYGIVSLWQLGGTRMPSTTWQPTQEVPQSFILELTDRTDIDAIYTIYGEGDNNLLESSYQLGYHGLLLEGSNDLTTWETVHSYDEEGAIYQYDILEGSWNYRYYRITAINSLTTLSEIGFRTSDDAGFAAVQVLEDEGADSDYPAELVIDEQDQLVLEPTYMDESYFDEVYHPRNAWEIANGIRMYAHVHPLLGTCLIALSIRLFGMNPLAWRLPGALTGIALVPLMYAVLKSLFVSSRSALFGTILLAADFMHVTTSRIATLEPFSVFFILLMYWYMIRFFKTSFYDTDVREQLKLLFRSGLAMGLGIATKWTACYSAVGLAVILFTNLIRRWQEKKKAVRELAENPDLSPLQQQQLAAIRDQFGPCFRKIIAWCFLFFIGIPVVIYFAVYLFTPVWSDGWSIAHVLEQIDYIYHYHINLKATHPYQSTWYMWLVDARPIWYYSGTFFPVVQHSISCFSNPAICWAGLIAILYTIVSFFRTRSWNAYLIAVGYLSAFLPWMLVDRCVFAYHFYPTSFFMIMAIVYWVRQLVAEKPQRLRWVRVYTVVCVILFAMFMPATMGFGTTISCLKFLEWFPSWYFG